MKPIWNSRSIQLQTKLRLFISNVKTVLLYGSETWRHTQTLDKKLRVFVNTCLRQFLRIRWQPNTARCTLDWNPQGSRKRGRPALTRRRTLQIELQKTKMSWGEAEDRCSEARMPQAGWRRLSKYVSIIMLFWNVTSSSLCWLNSILHIFTDTKSLFHNSLLKQTLL